jgi:hypothetical protein
MPEKLLLHGQFLGVSEADEAEREVGIEIALLEVV